MPGHFVALCGSVVILVGSAMQALTELREYQEFRAAVSASDFPDPRWELPELAYVVTHLKPWWLPLTLPMAIVEWFQKLREAQRAFSEHARGDPEAARVRAGLARMRNWLVVVLGAALLVVAAAMEL